MKTETKHTPGPWHVQAIGGERYVEANGPQMICDMQRGEALSERDIAEIDANARLIAAAPAMLEELTTLRADKAELLKVLQELMNEMNSRFDYEQASESELKAFNKAHALITNHTKS